MQLASNIAHVSPYYSTVVLGSALTELDDDILEIISVHQPIMTRHIASLLSGRHQSYYSRRDINSRLFKTLSNHLIQDDYFRWSLRHGGMEYLGQEEDPEKGQYTEDKNAVNLDSTVKIKYSNGKESMISFTKASGSISNNPTDISYVYYKSPGALALLTKKVGDICHLPFGQCEVLEID